MLILLVSAIFSVTRPAHAQSTPEIIGSVIPLEQSNDLRAQPLALLAKFPNAGTAMAQYVAQTFARAPSLVDSILSIINDASPEQASAIGAGLVRGLRVLDAKNPAISQSITSKVMSSSNPWLKTTFRAIGPSYASNVPFVMPERVPTPLLGSTTVGTELPDYKSRVGARDPRDLTGVRWGENGKQPSVFARDPSLLGRYGTIVALLASDAPSNGAVSTSPTN